MNYWHMQLHPKDIKWEREKELLEKKKLIGVGLASKSSTNQFLNKMNIDDIVLIRRGMIPVALVKIVGKAENIGQNDINGLDWFQYRRKVEIIEFAKSKTKSKFPVARGTLKIVKDERSPAFEYIDDWYSKTVSGIKLIHLFIDKYKMFRNFNISFLSDNAPSPLIVLAGVNGSGKTSLLEFIRNFVQKMENYSESYVKFEDSKEGTLEILNKMYAHEIGKKSLDKIFEENVIYTPLMCEIDSLKEIIVKYQKKLMRINDLRPSESYAIMENSIRKILIDLNIEAEIDEIDENDKIYFRNKSGARFSIDDLSSGQKTILIKILNLLFDDVKGKVVLIDEPELSLHPAWQNKVLSIYEKFAIDNNCQIIIATHSPHIIGSAENKYLRLLKFNEENNVEVVSDLTAYGREVTWVLEEVMGVEYTREISIKEKIAAIENLLSEEKYKDAEKQIEALENLIGKNDRDLVRLKTVLDFNKD